MIQLKRIVEDQSALWSYRATQDEGLAQQLELLIDVTKPNNQFSEWHPLIATSFRYTPPLRIGRFCPTNGRNVFYGSSCDETALYEYSYHLMKQRISLPLKTEPGTRTIYSVNADDSNSVDIRSHENITAIMDRNDYAASHIYTESNNTVTFIKYPSCRDPNRRENTAILDISHLDRNPIEEMGIKYFYNNTDKKIKWIDYNLEISWSDVS